MNQMVWLVQSEAYINQGALGCTGLHHRFGWGNHSYLIYRASIIAKAQGFIFDQRSP